MVSEKQLEHRPIHTKRELVRMGGKLREIITIHDHQGKMLHKVMTPLMLEFHGKDAFQAVIGSTIIGCLVAFREETFTLADKMPLSNVIVLACLSVFFIAMYVYYNFFKEHMEGHWDEYIKRVFSVYVISFIVVAVLLNLIDKTPWKVDWLLSLKRVLLVTLPSCLGATLADHFQ